jgi:hypothetical protein
VEVAIVDSSELLESLTYFRLLEAGQIEQLTRSLQGRAVEPAALAQRLVESGWLTHYQAQQLLNGRVQELVLGPYVLLERLGEGGMGWSTRPGIRRLAGWSPSRSFASNG